MKVRDSLLAHPVVVRLLLRDDESENRTHDSIQWIQYGFKASRDRKKCSPGSGIPRIIQVSWSRVAYQIPSQQPNANNRIPGRVLSPQSSLKMGYPEWIFWRSLRCKYISRITGRLFAFISSSLEGSHKQYMESGVHWIQQRGNWILFHWSQSRAAAVPLSRLHFRSLGVWNILLSLLVLIPPFATIQLDGGIAGWIITLPFYYSPPMTFVVPFFLSIVGAFINKSAKEAARGGGKNGESISRWTALVHCVVFVSGGK